MTINFDFKSFFLQHWQKLAAVLLVCFIGFQFWQQRQMESRAEAARVEAQNRLAEMSRVIEENNNTWSRLAQERDDLMEQLSTRNSELADLIRSRDETIQNLTSAMVNIRPIRVVVNRDSGGNITETREGTDEAPRLRVDFSQMYEDTIRISGYTLTNPAEAEVGLDFTRPINFTVATTQLEDLSWRTYISSDFPGMTIGEIETSVNPLSRPAERRGWERDLEISLLGGATVTGNSGYFGAGMGYDFGPITATINAGGITYPGATDFMVGGMISFAPFDF